jgi:uncharacterized membrane protein YhaH (DUF805 family)
MAKQGEWPGARRRSFILVNLFFPVLWAFGFTAVTPFLTTQFGPEMMKVIAPASNIVPFFVALVISLQRLVNLGMSRWWYLGNFIPILNFWVGYRCFACPAGYAFHKKLDGAGIFLAILYWLMIVVVILMIAAVVAVMFGALGSPELREKLYDVLRMASASQP